MRATAALTTVVLSACALMAATAASADTTIYASDNGGGPSSPTFQNIGIPVTAHIGTICSSTGLVPNGTVDMGLLNVALPNKSVGLSFQCNGPFLVGIVSSNGGMQGPAAPFGFHNLRDYNIQLSITDTTGAVHTSNTCLASALKATAASSTCTTSLRGPSPTSGFEVDPATDTSVHPSNLLLSDAEPIPANLVASALDGYQDTLTVTLAPKS